MINTRKGLVPILVTVMLLLVSIGVYLYVQDWSQNQQDDFETQIPVESRDFSRNIEILEVRGSQLLIRNNFQDNLDLDSILIGEIQCSIPSDLKIARGVVAIDIGNCTQDISSIEPYEVRLSTSAGIKTKYELVRDSIGMGIFTLAFQTGPCDFSSGFVRILGMSSPTNAHVEVANNFDYTYNLCARHSSYSISANPSTSSLLLMSLLSQTNSHVFTDKVSVYQAPSPWYDIHIGSSAGVFDRQIQVSSPGDLYQCAGALEVNNQYGAHLSNCDNDSMTKIWVSLI